MMKASSDAPLSIGSVTLLTKNRATVAQFYCDVIGLNIITQSEDLLTLGQGDRALLHLREESLARIRPTEAGLFHTAFVLPAREDLSAWIRYASETRVKLDGAADHSVSEALYLQDPEGNGVEIYVDRNRFDWTFTDSEIDISTGPLDLKKLQRMSDKPWQAAPVGMVIGHVHLKVGDVARSDAFYRDVIGFARTVQMPNASFYGSGGYHHHIAGNTWQSRGAGKRSEDSTGLLHIELLTNDEAEDNRRYVDPWGIELTVSKAPASAG